MIDEPNYPSLLVMSTVCFSESEKIVSKSTNILEQTIIFQLGQKYLIFHINVAKETENLVTRNLNVCILLST